MSYLTSGFITLPKSIPFKPRNTKEPSYRGSKPSLKSTKKSCLYNLKDFKQESIQEPYKANKTPPLVLFINLLMKDGKKTHALRVLSMTLCLFKARISKIRLQKHVSSLKNSQSFYQYFNNPGERLLQDNSWQTCFSKKTLANYSIKASSLSLFFSKKSGTNNKGSKLLNVAFPWYLNYKKTFPFLFDFSRVFNDFYTKNSFFSGKFLDLKQYSLVKKNEQESALYLFGPLEKRKNYFFKKKSDQCMPHKGNFVAIIGQPYLQKSALLCPTEASTGPSAPMTHTTKFKASMQSKHEALNYFAKENNTNPLSFQNKEGGNSKNGLWYKTLAKKPSWEKLTSAQKNTFLFCLYKAISNVKPPLECRTKRIGGSNKQIPSQVSEHRQWGIAIRWIIEVAQNEFSRKKNKIAMYKPVNSPILSNISKASENVQDRLKFPRGLAVLKKKTLQSQQSQLVSWALDEKTRFLSSLLQRKAKAGGLKVHSQKTRFYLFCFFLAESLENAYYKTGPAMQKRNLWVETALANRAFLRYRWW